MSIGYGELKKGMAIELDGQPYIVAEYERSKMQKRALFLVLVLTSCDVKRLTYANEYSIAISHKVGSEWDS